MADDQKGLAEYVRRIMGLKSLTQRDIEDLSGGTITSAYVASILTGRAKNLSVEKLKALALGLGVEADELFHVALGQSNGPQGQSQASYRSDPLVVLEIIQKVLVSPSVAQILEEVLNMTDDERGLLLKSARILNKAKQSAS